MLNINRPLFALALGAAIIPLAGCASGFASSRSDTRYVARDVNTLYTAAYDRLQQGDYAASAAIFDEVERQHPYSIWARRAQLMSAFSYYAMRDYQKSIDASRRFLAIHPGNRSAPYALYLIALSQYEQISDVTRDQGITQQALASLGELIRRYPNSAYADDARLKVDLVRDHLAGKEMEVGRFYQRRRQWLASVHRFRNVIDNYQTTTHAPEALMRLTESYVALGIPMEAQRSAAVLGANYPSSPWYRRAYNLMQAYPNMRPLRAEPLPTPAEAAAASGEPPRQPTTAPPTPEVGSPSDPAPNPNPGN
ncbi:MAG: outer membrane protein assembly factor BamD [Alphaproteobacteria bacterium]|jgi:outer membrane protein assembly factor BamD|nr:outer membrane protein assembly factor BamD [Alphaproteobacteria bacterium]